MNAALLQIVDNRGAPPEAFLNELIAWGRTAPADIFEKNERFDIYSMTSPRLGPYPSLNRRKAVMMEVLRVLAGFESSWRWNEGKDASNPTENTLDTESAGPFQISANSMYLDASLRACAGRYGVIKDSKAFRALMMTSHVFAFEYTARLLRVNLQHNGPVKRSEILPWLKRNAVDAFMTAITL